jgi:hypothetical protein
LGFAIHRPALRHRLCGLEFPRRPRMVLIAAPGPPTTSVSGWIRSCLCAGA